MIHEVTWMSQDAAVRIDPTAMDAMISITGRETEPAPLNERWGYLLRLVFDDYAPSTDGMAGMITADSNPIIFKEHHAVSIIQYVNELQKNGDQLKLFVHCFAGLSRSPAVAHFVMEHLGLRQEKPIRCNRYVLGLLRKVASS